MKQVPQLLVLGLHQQKPAKKLALLGTLSLAPLSQAASSPLNNQWRVIWVEMTLILVKQVRNLAGCGSTSMQATNMFAMREPGHASWSLHGASTLCAAVLLCAGKGVVCTIVAWCQKLLCLDCLLDSITARCRRDEVFLGGGV